MKKPNYIITAQAETDLAEIMAYIADDDVVAAVSLIDRFYDIFELLADNPKAGRERPELESGLSSIPEGSYMIFYRIWAGEVAISRVVHAARDLDEIFS